MTNFYILDFRGAKTGGPVLPGKLVHGTEDSLRLESKVVFLLHGFNVNRKEGKEGLSRLAGYLASIKEGAIVIVLWPGDHWTGPLSYSFEGRDADDTALELTRYIERVIPSQTPISFIAHSLGSRVTMETISHLLDSDYPVNQVCLMAAAVDDYSLACPDEYLSVAQLCERIAVLSSKRDNVLKYAYPTGDFIQKLFFFHKEHVGFALGYKGPKQCKDHNDSNYPVPNNILHIPIPDNRDADHDDYIPDENPTKEQLSAAKFADEVVGGEGEVSYG